MGTVSVSLPSDGTTADVSDYNTPITSLVNEFNGNIENANIKTTAGITGEKLADGVAGMFGAWPSWTPAWTNLTTGNGTLNYAKYNKQGRNVEFFLSFTLGSTSSVGTAPLVSLPVTATSDFGTFPAPIGMCVYTDTGTANYFGMVHANTTSTARLSAMNASSTYLAENALSSTIPMTWASTDIIWIHGKYEAAA